VTDTFREQVRENAFRFDQFTSTSALFLPGGQLPAAGAVFRNLDLAATYAMTTVQALHHYLEATRLAFADRNRYIGDPSQVPVPAQQLLSASFGRQRACLINPAKAATSPVPPGDPFAGAGGCVPAQPAPTGQPSDGASTNNLVVADRWGDVVSYTTTIEELGGNADPAEPPRRRRAGSPWRRRCRRREPWLLRQRNTVTGMAASGHPGEVPPVRLSQVMPAMPAFSSWVSRPRSQRPATEVAAFGTGRAVQSVTLLVVRREVIALIAWPIAVAGAEGLVAPPHRKAV
jgi:hypothetical protein